MKKAKKQANQETAQDDKKLAAEYLIGWQKERANFENYRKRMEKRNLDLIRFANEELLHKILPVLDHLDQAMKHIPKGWEETSWVEGIQQIQKQFLTILESEGVSEIPVKKGDVFDPAMCEAIATEKKEGKKKECTITEVLHRGYVLNGKTLRPARVKVCS